MSSSILSALERLTAITELLYDYEEEYSITDIAERLHVPIGVIRNDLSAISLSREFGASLYLDDSDFDTGSSKEFAGFISSGALDEMTFHLDKPASLQEDVFHTVGLSLSEYQALESLYPEIDAVSRYPLCLRKTICPTLNEKTREYRSVLQSAISHKNPMQISYTAANGDCFRKSILPVAFSHNVLENLVYVISYENGQYLPYRIDRIKRMRPSFEKMPYPSDLRILEKLPYVWGMEYNFQPEVEPIKVKLAIVDEGNVLYKVKRDIAYRPKSLLYQKNRYWIYEDSVIGLNNFRSWVFSYGSSMLVLEPVELQKAVLASYEYRLSEQRVR